jgi:hypothetical protein
MPFVYCVNEYFIAAGYSFTVYSVSNPKDNDISVCVYVV